MTGTQEVMHLIAASNQATILESAASRRVRTVPGDAPTTLAISRKLAPCSRSLAISSLFTIRRGPLNVFFFFAWRLRKRRPDPFLNQRSLKFGHRTDNLKHQSTRWRG